VAAPVNTDVECDIKVLRVVLEVKVFIILLFLCDRRVELLANNWVDELLVK
jgi:hypothetical protein